MNPTKFSRIAESLRQYRRAELKDFDEELGGDAVAKLYVDPLPNDAVLQSVLSSNSTFLLGRKGTGKSTVFSRAQAELRRRQDTLSVYVDVKSLYDVISPSVVTVNGAEAVDPGVLGAHMLRKAFLGSVLAELLKDIDKACDQMSMWDRWVSGARRTYQDASRRLRELSARLNALELQSVELPVLQRITRKVRQREQAEHGTSLSGGVGASIAPTSAKLQSSVSAADFDKTLEDKEVYQEYSEVVLRSFPFMEFLEEVRGILESSGLKRFVFFFDDFSELGLVDQRLFVDVILSPLNNSSGELIKLKVAGYPGRVYYGKIDSTKVDTISLDFCDLYEDAEVQSLERAAIDYMSRLVKCRFSAFGENAEDYFDEKVGFDQHMRLLFQVTFNVPRLVGALLHICYLDSISGGEKITQAALRLAARKYYEATVAQYFERMNRFALEPFENKLDRHNQQLLLRHVLAHARGVRSEIIAGRLGGNYFEALGSALPTSHFLVGARLAHVFQSLESNFLISRYKNTRDKDGRAAVVFALYYGLTESERLSWGYPTGREYRNYFVQRCFDYSAIVQGFLAENQTIRCGECGSCFPLEQENSLKLYRWECPECRVGVCSIVNLADDFVEEVDPLRQGQMLERVELSILEVLNEERRPMRAGEIGALIDTTHQMVGRRTSKLRDLKLVEKGPADDGIIRSSLSREAKAIYFSG